MFKLLVPAIFLCAASCSYRNIDELKFGPGEYRCESDGFCLYPAGNYSLQAAFREGSYEIRVDVVDAQIQRNISHQNFAVLVSDQHDNPLMLSESGRIPRSWKISHQNSHAVKHISEFTAERFIRERLVQELARGLQVRGQAKDIDREEAYVIARQIIEDLVERDDGFRSGDPAPIPKRLKKALHGRIGPANLPNSARASFSANYEAHDLQEALAVGSTQAVGRDDAGYRQLQQQLQPVVSGNLLEGDILDKSEYVRTPFFDFQ